MPMVRTVRFANLADGQAADSGEIYAAYTRSRWPGAARLDDPFQVRLWTAPIQEPGLGGDG